MALRVIAIEDELAARERLASLDTWNGKKFNLCGMACNGEEGWELFVREQPDLVLTDIEMPLLNGLELIERINAAPRPAPAVILSCHESFEYACKAVSLGVKEYLVKDFLSREQLESVLCRFLPSPVNQKGKSRTGFEESFFEGAECLILPDPDRLEARLIALKEGILQEDRGELTVGLEELYGILLPGMVRYRFVRMVNNRLLSYFHMLLEKKNIPAFDFFNDDPLYALSSQSNLEEMKLWWLSCFDRILGREGKITVKNPRIKRVIQKIRSDYTRDWSLEEMADEIGLHKVYLSRMFKQETGTNFYEYLQTYRLERACTLLVTSDKKISQIATSSGFRNYDQFSVIFKKYKGCSPGEYRKKG